jgi:aminoglycoside 6'-N-acetyltransferase I
MRVRQAVLADLEALSALRARLWPSAPLAEHRDEARAILDGTFRSTMPLSVLVAEVDGRLIGFAEVGLRSHADGCDPSYASGYLEGWYVEPEHRRRGVGGRRGSVRPPLESLAGSRGRASPGAVGPRRGLGILAHA